MLRIGGIKSASVANQYNKHAVARIACVNSLSLTFRIALVSHGPLLDVGIPNCGTFSEFK